MHNTRDATIRLTLTVFFPLAALTIYLVPVLVSIPIFSETISTTDTSRAIRRTVSLAFPYLPNISSYPLSDIM